MMQEIRSVSIPGFIFSPMFGSAIISLTFCHGIQGFKPRILLVLFYNASGYELIQG
jgi:hypothetical protein